MQDSASLELLLSAYLDPWTKNFIFVDENSECQQCLAKARVSAEKLLSKTQIKLITEHQIHNPMSSEMGHEKSKEKEM